MAPMPVQTTSTAWARWLAWAGALACLAGIALDRTWEAIAWPRVGETVVLALSALAAAWPCLLYTSPSPRD